MMQAREENLQNQPVGQRLSQGWVEAVGYSLPLQDLPWQR